MNEKKKSEVPAAAALPYYAASDSDLPQIFSEQQPAPDTSEQIPARTTQPNRFFETRLRVLREAREMGLRVTPQEIDTCTILIFSIQQSDEEAKARLRDK